MNILQMLYTYLPVSRQLFDMRPVSLANWGLILIMGLALFVLVAIEKGAVRHWRDRRRARHAITRET